ncbi:hypothetical protein HX109_03375 [Galbibacter sp. BG1]|uniref:hypothetical protein n=1 Tax=Galbibacter sp. BG1 TaxID=1170699 RepID=UPI0015B99858|nr:hypothetical protein [Galbibacter sp. BG1]QLE00648.1 hypothetical protein HX109_03375 [Galbibacter sp. BG1]
MKKIVLGAAMLFVFGGAFVSCKETEEKKEVIIKEESTEVEEEGILERAGKEVDEEVNEEIDETIEKIGDED